MYKLKQHKILLVDDRSENLLSLSAVLKKAGYQTDSALSGKEALKLLLKNEYGLLILDVQMPEMNGFELAELIKGNSKTKDIPLIFLSANALEKEFSLKGIEAGALDYLAKPVDETLLLLKVKNFLDLHNSKLQLFEANKLLEKRAIQAQISYQDLYYSLSQDIYILNKEGIIVSINRNGKLICGLTVHDLIDQHYSKSPFLAQIFGSTNKKRNILSYFENADHTAKHIEFKVHLNPQSVFYGEAVITVAVIEGKHLIQIAITDETERKKQEEQLKKTVKELNNRNNELMQFNYIVSHNLRSPIANLIGLSTLINTPDLKEKDKPKILDYIHQSALKMDDQIKDLNVVLSARSALNEIKERVSFPFLIESILNTLALQINESVIVIQTEIHPDAIEIFSIKSYLESILYNLISNAIKYKSSIRTPTLRIEIKKIGGAFEIKVSDNGIGIDLNLYGDYVFGLYKRFNLEIEGKGLGLHMTKNQVEALGGTITVESVLDKGTIFSITLPV